MTDQERPSVVIPTSEEIQQLNLPSPLDTKQAIDGIAAERNEAAATALRELSLAIIDAVTRVDQAYGVHDFLVELKLCCSGPGMFRLDIQDKNSDADPQQVADSVVEQIRKESAGDYYKPARSIQMEFSHERKSQGPDGVPPE